MASDAADALAKTYARNKKLLSLRSITNGLQQTGLLVAYKAYKLAPMELRVLLAVVGVRGVPEVAEALGTLGVRPRLNLGRIYEKTGSHRQVDLVAGFSNPFITWSGTRRSKHPSILGKVIGHPPIGGGVTSSGGC
jgi:hypothetical protein